MQLAPQLWNLIFQKWVYFVTLGFYCSLSKADLWKNSIYEKSELIHFL